LPLPTLIALIIIVITLVGVVIGRYPWLRMNRASIALVGATLFIVIGAIPLEKALPPLALISSHYYSP